MPVMISISFCRMAANVLAAARGIPAGIQSTSAWQGRYTQLAQNPWLRQIVATAERPAGPQESRRVLHQLHQDRDAESAAVERGLRLVLRDLGMHLLHLGRRDIRRVAREKVAVPDEFRGFEGLEQVADSQVDPLAE